MARLAVGVARLAVGVAREAGVGAGAGADANESTSSSSSSASSSSPSPSPSPSSSSSSSEEVGGDSRVTLRCSIAPAGISFVECSGRPKAYAASHLQPARAGILGRSHCLDRAPESCQRASGPPCNSRRAPSRETARDLVKVSPWHTCSIQWVVYVY